MIKLQLLLVQASATPALDAGLAARLAQAGLRITGHGRASISAEVSEPDFARLFGVAPPHPGGFVANPADTPALPIPPELRDAIRLITLVPRHHIISPH